MKRNADGGGRRAPVLMNKDDCNIQPVKTSTAGAASAPRDYNRIKHRHRMIIMITHRDTRAT